MEKRYKAYDPEFKRRAIALARELGNALQAAKRLGLPKHQIYNWIRSEEIKGIREHKGEELVKLCPDEELRLLRRENEELRKANQILKQAAAFFSQDHLK